MKRHLFFSFILLFIASLVSAETHRDRRQEKQEKRIAEGMESGEINQQEAARLKANQIKLQELENKAQKDGTVTRREKKRLNKVQNRESRRIYRVKHNKD